MSKFEVKLSYDDVVKFVRENSKCKFKSKEYFGIKDKYEFECECGETFYTTFEKFRDRNKRQCNKCGRKKRVDNDKLTYEYIVDYVKNNSESKLLSLTYENYDSLLEFECKCGNKFKTSFRYFSGKGNKKITCDECGKEIRDNGKKKYTYEYVKNLLEEHNCELITKKTKEHITRKQKIIVKCSCGEEFSTILETIITYNKYQCTICSFEKAVCSLGEIKIEEILDAYELVYRREYSFSDCINKIRLRYDFAVFNNGILQCLIEYDGKQHFQAYDYYGGDKTFNKIKKRDNIKNEYCNKNNIKLLRIPYWDFDNIESILKEHLM